MPDKLKPHAINIYQWLLREWGLQHNGKCPVEGAKQPQMGGSLCVFSIRTLSKDVSL